VVITSSEKRKMYQNRERESDSAYEIGSKRKGDKCVISSQKGPKTRCFGDPNCVRVAMKKKKSLSLFRDGKTLDAERFLFSLVE
jgi:hypothetical protein